MDWRGLDIIEKDEKGKGIGKIMMREIIERI